MYIPYEKYSSGDKLYLEKQRGKNANAHSELKKMMDFVREGDIIVIESISRFARNAKDLLSLADELKGKGADFVNLKESIDTTTPQGQFMLTVFAAMAQLERDCILECQCEGIFCEGARQVTMIQIDENTFQAECAKWRAGEITATAAMKRLGLKPNTFYRRVKRITVN